MDSVINAQLPIFAVVVDIFIFSSGSTQGYILTRGQKKNNTNNLKTFSKQICSESLISNYTGTILTFTKLFVCHQEVVHQSYQKIGTGTQCGGLNSCLG